MRGCDRVAFDVRPSVWTPGGRTQAARQLRSSVAQASRDVRASVAHARARRAHPCTWCAPATGADALGVRCIRVCAHSLPPRK